PPAQLVPALKFPPAELLQSMARTAAAVERKIAAAVGAAARRSALVDRRDINGAPPPVPACNPHPRANTLFYGDGRRPLSRRGAPNPSKKSIIETLLNRAQWCGRGRRRRTRRRQSKHDGNEDAAAKRDGGPCFLLPAD